MENVGITAANSKRCMDVVAVILSVFMLTYVNVVKNPRMDQEQRGAGHPGPIDSREDAGSVLRMDRPVCRDLVQSGLVRRHGRLAMLIVHLRRPVAVIPQLAGERDNRFTCRFPDHDSRRFRAIDERL